MAREKLKLKLMLSQDITTMVTLMDMAMAMDTMVMERGKLKPLLLLKLMLSQAIIIMDMAIMDMVDMDIMDMDMERGRPPPLTIVMILVDMIMALFISFVAVTAICWNLLIRNTDLYLQ